MRTATRAAVAAVVAALLSAGAGPASGSIAPAPAATPIPTSTASDVITSSGPLARIEVTPDLNCAVQHTADRGPAFFEGTACATLLSLSADGESVLYGPAEIPGSGRYAQLHLNWGSNPQTLTGTGTSADPYRLQTVWSSGDNRKALSASRGVTVVETDSYVVGEDSYQTDIDVTNGFSSPLAATIYHAADCQVADSDVGLGSYSPTTGAITCHAPGASGGIEAAGRAISFVPLTPGSAHLYGDAARVWSVVGAQDPFPNAVEGGDDPSVDTAIGLSWSVSLAAGASTTASLRTSFAPTDVLPLPSSISLSTGSVGVGGQATASVSVENPNPFTQVIDPLTATLPPGVEYVAGSTRGLGEPVLDGRILDFGMVSVAANQWFRFTFAVTATAAGTGALATGGRTRSGVPVTSASATLVVNPQPSPSGTSSSGAATGRVTPVAVAWGSWGALAAAVLIVAGATTIAVTRRPRRVQKKLVRVHVRLDPQQATVIRHPPPREDHLPTPPAFRLEGRGGNWTHRVIEEQT